MKQSILIICVLLGSVFASKAQSAVDGVSVDGFKMERNGKLMSIDMTLHLSDLKVNGNRAVLLTPRLVNGTNSIELPSIGIYGRRRYYYYVRNGESMLSGKSEQSYRYAQKPDSIVYNEIIPYEEWMNGAELSLHRSEWGCCNTLLAEQDGFVGNYAELAKFIPELIYVRPQAEAVKSRSLQGSAYIDFPVNKTAIYPDYRRNTIELGKIQATIDSVRNDRDVTITSVWLKGYASPESPYEHNKELAIGRTEALKTYIQQFYHFGKDIISTDYEPEDWTGLRRYVEESDLEHKQEILALIDSDREPDNKEWKIKSTYPEDYRFLLQNCYPALRHTDYRIAYDIRSYSNIEEIRRIMQTQPQKLSLNEFYLVAQELEPGTDEFTKVFETAASIYPDDEIANLNAANAAMNRGNNAEAMQYIAKAGHSPEAIYARGALAILMDNYEMARSYLAEADSLGISQAATALEELAKRGH